jgi:hypothetical protein
MEKAIQDLLVNNKYFFPPETDVTSARIFRPNDARTKSRCSRWTGG